MAKKINWKIKMKNTIRCPWCGRMVKISGSRRLMSHIVSKGIKCVGIGQPVDAVKEYWKRWNQEDHMKTWRELKDKLKWK